MATPATSLSAASAATTGPSLLLIDDDIELCRLIGLYLSKAGCKLTCSTNGRDGVAKAISNEYDLVLLDVTLPQLDGFAVLHQVRRSSTIPIIMLTSRSMAADRLTGLNGGADDYLCKPFDPDELLARVRAVLRRSETSASIPTWHTIGPLRISETSREVLRDNTPINFTSIEFELLLMLSRANGRVVTRDALTTAIQDRRPSPFDRSLDVHISHIRTKLGPEGSRVRTIRGTGYALVTGEEDPR
jgi:two-component system response regulator CpxR